MFRILALLLTGILATSLNADEIKLTIAQGVLVGSTSPGTDVSSFKGIPFAKPPIGSRRWQHAEQSGGWEGERLATLFGPTCLQRPYAAGSIFTRPSMLMSEDCLYLNVWSEMAEKEKRPVMVWFHGGSLTRGTGATRAYDGTQLALKGVVLVTINYRLDLFGYFNHPDLNDGEGNPLANFGTTDQVMALRWVQDNIAAFGGDPDKVTIFGESAGSFSVHHMMASPLAKGLFHRAIGQSGSGFRGMLDIRDQGSKAHENSKKFQAKTGANSFVDMKQIDGQALLAAGRGFSFRPVVDGTVFREEIGKQFASGEFNAVPLMVGFNAHEGTTLGALRRLPESSEAYLAFVHRRYGELADEYLTLYPASDLRAATLDAFRDSFVTWAMQSWAMSMERMGQPSYLYYFTFEPLGPRLGAYHAAEIIYAFNNANSLAQGAPKARKRHARLADKMSDYWVNFAHSGDPNGKGLEKWKPYTADERHYLELGEMIKSGKNLLPGAWELHQKIRGLN